MATKKKEWITSQQAADILTQRSGHLVSADYVRRLANSGKLTTEALDSRTKLFLRADVENYVVKKRGTGEIRKAIREKHEAKVHERAKDAELESWRHKP